MDLKLTDYDLDLTNGELSFVTGRDAIAQDVQMNLRTWLGETVYDTTAGVPWLQVIFKGKNPNLDSVKFILEQNILRRPGVAGVELTLDFDRDARVLNVSGTLESIEGEIDFSELIEVTPAKIRATFGNNTNTSTASMMGQLVNIVAEFRAFDQQILLAVYRAFDPNSAVGVALDRLAALTGSVRKGSTVSVVDVVLSFVGPGIVNNGDLFQNDDTSTQWSATGGPYADTGGPYPEAVAGVFAAVDPGPTLANAGTNWSLVTVNAAVGGVTNPADDADPGRLQETDVDFRIRRQVELFGGKGHLCPRLSQSRHPGSGRGRDPLQGGQRGLGDYPLPSPAFFARGYHGLHPLLTWRGW